MNKKIHSVERRDFLKTSAVIGAGIALSPLTVALRTALGAETTVISAAHWGPLAIKVVDGKIISSGPAVAGEMDNSLQTVVADQVYSPVRIRQPMVRKGFLDNIDNPQNPDGKRGSDEFVPVSWDEAYELITQQLRRVRESHGSKGIFAGSYGWRSSGALHTAHTLLHRFMNLTGGFVGHRGDYSTAAAQVIMPHVVGSIEVYEQQTSWEVVLEHSDVVVFWGANPLNTLKIAWTVSDCHGLEYLNRLAESGKRIIFIDPMRSETYEFFGDSAEWITPNPSTDVALMLGIAHELIANDKHDADFLKKYTVGFEEVQAYIMGDEDGVAKTAEWAAGVSGVSAETIKDLAGAFADNRTMIMAGWAMQRQHLGEQAHWMVVTLASMLGQIGLPGGGFGLSYHYSNGGVPTRKAGVISSMTATSSAGNASTSWLDEVSELSIPVARIADALHNPGATIPFNGTTVTFPDIKLIWWCGGSPFQHHQDLNRLRSGWQKPEVVIVSDPYWTPTAKHADIVLPITTTYERNDLSMTGDYSNMHVVPMKKVVEPQHQAKDDFEVFRALSARFGVEQEYTEGKDEMRWLEGFYDAGSSAARAQRIAMPRFQQFWNSNEVFQNPVDESARQWVRYADFRNDPILSPLGTPSGKFELYSRTIEAMNYEDCPAHATWMEPVEYLGNATPDFPVHMLSPHPAHRLHGQLNYASLREKYAVADREPVWIHPDDASERGIADGDLVRIFNARGQVLAGAVITDRVKKNVIALHQGAWYDPADGSDNALCKNGCANVLAIDRGTSSLAQGNCGHTALVNFEKYQGEAPALSAFTPPPGAA